MTTTAFETDYDADVSNGISKATGGTTVRVSGLTNARRCAWRFPYAGSLDTATSVTDVTLQINVTAENVESTDTVNFNMYGTDAQGDLEADSAATMNTNCAGTTLVSVTTEIQATGSATVDLGASADSQVLANVGSPDRFTVGMTQTNFASTEEVSFEAIENAGTDPATLTVVWTAPGGLALRTLMGAGI